MGIPGAGRRPATATVSRVPESVWEYPRPPALQPCARRVRIELGDHVVADSRGALRILETSHPPTIYVPPADVDAACFEAVERRSLCEWKGIATYLDVVAGERRERAAAWTYRDPAAPYAALRDHVAVYPGRMDACWLDDERVRSQEGDFYGGWITDDVVGPFKGGPGSHRW
ncbi:MAG: hypothetical protein QOG56_105 [Solirubrobacteraceae bacterium]|nr:hypothetical protein [Solirubrobacteraceae bacterium]